MKTEMQPSPDTHTPTRDEGLTGREMLLGGGLLATLLAKAGCAPLSDPDLLAEAGLNAKARAPNPASIASGAVGEMGGGPEQMTSVGPRKRLTPKMLGMVRDLSAGLAPPPVSKTQATSRGRDLTLPEDPQDLKYKLISRMTWGVSPDEVALFNQLGYDGYLEYHLDYEAIDDSSVESALTSLTTLQMNAQDLYLLDNQGQVIIELILAQLHRSIYSRRQFHERMVEFWTDHLNISILDGVSYVFKPIDDREVIRPNALGTFPDLIRASAHSPAMLFYLDNYSSFSGQINENYARELMELHTLGVDGGYTQADVRAVARCFTGWTIFGDINSPDFGTFSYYDPGHDWRRKTVLGNVIPRNGGQSDADTVLDILINHPSAARFIATKLCKWLWGESPPLELVDLVAATYTQTGGDIRAMVRAILSPHWLGQAPPKYKRPQHFVVSALRAAGVAVADFTGVFYALDAMGHIPFYWPTPDGYHDTVGHWSGLILPRWNFAADMWNDDLVGVTADPAFIIADAVSAPDVVNQINQNVFCDTMSRRERNRLIGFLAPNPANLPKPRRIRDAIGLAMSGPGFQWY